MFSFLKKKLGFGSSEPTPAPAPEAVPAPPPAIPAPPVAVEPVSTPAPQAPSPASQTAPVVAPPSTTAPAPVPTPSPNASVAAPSTVVAPAPVASPPVVHAPAPVVAVPTPVPATAPVAAAALVAEPEPAPRKSWMDKLRQGLRKTGSSIAQVFTGTQIDDALYEELEAALLMADAGVKATEFLLEDLKRRVKDAKATEPAVVRQLLVDALTELLQPLQRQLVIGEQSPMVMMVVGVNGAGKTTSIGKLTRHVQLLTPLDIEQRYRMPGGHWHHGELQADQMLMSRPVFGAEGYARISFATGLETLKTGFDRIEAFLASGR